MLRKLINKYRLLSGTLCALTLTGSLATTTVAVKFQTKSTAVAEFILQSLQGKDDVTQELNHPKTTQQMPALLERTTTMNPGGFVYAHEDHLDFYPFVPARARKTEELYRENCRVYDTLVPKFFIDTRETAQSMLALDLEERNINRTRMEVLAEKATHTRNDKNALVRAIGEYFPHQDNAYQLSLADILKFHEVTEPRGTYVGLYEVVTLAIDDSFDTEYAHSMAKNDHFFALRRVGNTLVISDFSDGREQRRTLPLDRSNLYKAPVDSAT